MKLLFIYPSMGEMENYKLKRRRGTLKTTSMEPLSIAALNGLTPDSWETSLFDDRVEKIDYSFDCDLVAISVETYTAKRAYEISAGFRKNGKTVIMGGFHPSIMPEESSHHCDSLLIGEAEEMWKIMLKDFENGKLKTIYKAKPNNDLSNIKVDKSIYGNKSYFPFYLIESGRGCNYSCEFCSVSLFFNRKFNRRPINEIIKEIKSTGKKQFMFVDDNICGDFKSATELFKALIPLKIKWAGQSSIDIVKDEELLDLMKKSGCIGLLIGFESFNIDNLKQMNKRHNFNINITEAIKSITKKGIRIYSSFIIGYDYDDEKSVKMTTDFAIKMKMFIANFYQLTPMPKTELYKRLENDNRLIYKKWWLNDEYSYGNLVFEPENITSEHLTKLSYEMKKHFYSFASIFKRALNFKSNSKSFKSFLFFMIVNFISRKETFIRQNRKLGRET